MIIRIVRVIRLINLLRVIVVFRVIQWSFYRSDCISLTGDQVSY
jgi:hypothetical protein